MRRPSIFVSYSRVDRHHVLSLLKVLDERQIPYFDYIRTPLEGVDLCTELREQVAEHDAIISILGSSSLDSEWFFLEFTAAAQLDIPQCVIQFARPADKPRVIATQPVYLIDASSDASLAVPGLEAWLDETLL